MRSIVKLSIENRLKYLRLIRTESVGVDLWDPSSPFIQILEHLELVYQNIPKAYHLDELNLYVLKDKRIVGAVFSFHFLLYAAIFDLTRISLAGFNFPLASQLQKAPSSFRTRCQELCKLHAIKLSDLIRQGTAFGIESFDDTFCIDAAAESAKIQIVYATTVSLTAESVRETAANILVNLDLMDKIYCGTEALSPYVSTCFCGDNHELTDSDSDHGTSLHSVRIS